MVREFDAAVIGAGPGGYVCAIRLGQLGLKTVIVDADKLGGTCLNYGCIPSKALIHASNVMEQVRHAGEMGIEVAAPFLNMGRLQQWKQGVVEKLTGGVGTLLKGNKVEVVLGRANFMSPTTIAVKSEKGEELIQAKHFVIATGGRPVELPGMAFDGRTIVSSKEALEFTSVPRRMVVIGGGIIGLEIGTLYAKLGSTVTVVEMLPTLLAGVDPELSAVVGRRLKKRGVQTHLESKVTELRRTDRGIVATVETKTSGTVFVETDVVLVAVGVKPFTEPLRLEKAGVALGPKGFVTVDAQLRTNVPHIFAIGDVSGPPLLAHKASKEGLVAAEVIAGHPEKLDVKAMPSAIFTEPEIATVGLSEPEAKLAGREVIVGKFPFGANGRALAGGDADGFVKLIGDKTTRELLGAGIVGPEASNLIAECALAIEMGAVMDDLSLTVHAHPTLPEAVMEAAEAALNRAIHTLNRR